MYMKSHSWRKQPLPELVFSQNLNKTFWNSAGEDIFFFFLLSLILEVVSIYVPSSGLPYPESAAKESFKHLSQVSLKFW